MASGRSTSSRQVPEWFDVKKYSFVDQLDLKGWTNQISIRAFLGWALSQKPELQLDSVIHQRLEEIASNPFIAAKKDDEHIEGWTIRKAERPYDTYSVWSLSTYFAYCYYNDFREPRDAFMREIKEACIQYDFGKARGQQEAITELPYDLVYKKQGISNEGMVTAVVDLSATDEQIVSDFRHWLTTYRKVVGVDAPRENFNPTDFKRWSAIGVLPYIDLTLWAKWKKITITQNALGEAIFPLERFADTTERIRRTTKPKAEHLMRSETARALEYQTAAAEIAKKMSAKKNA